MNDSSPPSGPTAAEDALRWFLRLREPDCSAEETRLFEQWLTAAPAHRTEYLAVQATWKHLDAVATRPSPELQRHLAQAMTMHAKPQKEHQREHRSRVIGPLTALAAMLLLVSGTLWWWSSFAVTESTYRTAKGMHQTVSLSDGTIMDLNTDSHVTVRMWGRGRQVILHTGEAYFTIANDTARPFEVVALNGRIHDIGTQFSVYRQAERVLVAVESGAIDVTVPSSGHGPSQAHILSPGERATYTTTGEWSQLDQVDPRRIAAWRQGTLRFERMPLIDAIREVERYWTGRILLADPALGTISVSGVFNHHDLAEFFTALPTIIPVQVTRRDGDIILSAPLIPPARPQ